MEPIGIFKNQIIKYLSKAENTYQNLIKYEVKSALDFSFACDFNVWHNYIEIQEPDKFKDNILIFAIDDDSPKDESHAILCCKKKSKDFIFQIESLQIENMKCCLKLVRNTTFKTVLTSISTSEYDGQCKNGETVAIHIAELENSSITNFRLDTIAAVLKNLVSYSPYVLAANHLTADYKLLLRSKSNAKKSDENVDPHIVVLCSIVAENNKKMSNQSKDEYLKKRMDEMHLMALHKYGVRIKSDDKFMQLREKLGESACKLDMIEVKHSNALILRHDPKQAFILYNSARIETLLKSFNEKVSCGYYPDVPKLADIDLNLLTGDEEWCLLKQLMLFPETVQKAIGDIQTGKIGVHFLHKYLHNLAVAFSNYYTKKKVLTENRPQLIPVLHAKIHLLKAIQAVFNKTLGIFDIQPVSFM